MVVVDVTLVVVALVVVVVVTEVDVIVVTVVVLADVVVVVTEVEVVVTVVVVVELVDVVAVVAVVPVVAVDVDVIVVACATKGGVMTYSNAKYTRAATKSKPSKTGTTLGRLRLGTSRPLRGCSCSPSLWFSSRTTPGETPNGISMERHFYGVT